MYLLCIIYLNVCLAEITVTCRGNPGHGSLMFANTAGEKVKKKKSTFLLVRNYLLKWKKGEFLKLIDPWKTDFKRFIDIKSFNDKFWMHILYYGQKSNLS